MVKKNQYNQDALFYTSPGGIPLTTLELRSLDKLTLYTEDNKVLNRFRHWSQLIYLVPYTQEQGEKHPVEVLVAADLYFPKSAKNQLLKALLRGK